MVVVGSTRHVLTKYKKSLVFTHVLVSMKLEKGYIQYSKVTCLHQSHAIVHHKKDHVKVA